MHTFTLWSVGCVRKAAGDPDVLFSKGEQQEIRLI